MVVTVSGVTVITVVFPVLIVTGTRYLFPFSLFFLTPLFLGFIISGTPRLIVGKSRLSTSMDIVHTTVKVMVTRSELRLQPPLSCKVPVKADVAGARVRQRAFQVSVCRYVC